MKAKNVLTVSCITIVLLMLLEVAARITLSRIYDRKFDNSLIVENKYGTSSGLRADATGTVWGKAFHTDDMGGRKHSKNKKGKPKLLVIGDSVAEGVGVDDSATFANIINDRLDSFDVRNISLIGWSVTDYKNALGAIIAADSTHEIKKIYLFYCLNDIYGKTAVKDLPAIADKGFLSRVNAFLQDRYATYKLIKLFAYQNTNHYYRYDEALYKDTNRVSAVIADLVDIKAVCDTNNVAFTVFILPYRSQLYNGNHNLPQRVLGDEFRKNNIGYVDLLTKWPSKRSYDDMYLFADEIHLSTRGHRVVADIVSGGQ